MSIPLKPYSKKELCSLYDVSYKTLQRWLTPFQEKIGEYIAKRYTVKQVQTIFECLGEPGNE